MSRYKETEKYRNGVESGVNLLTIFLEIPRNIKLEAVLTLLQRHRELSRQGPRIIGGEPHDGLRLFSRKGMSEAYSGSHEEYSFDPDGQPSLILRKDDLVQELWANRPETPTLLRNDSARPISVRELVEAFSRDGHFLPEDIIVYVSLKLRAFSAEHELKIEW